MSEQAAEQMSGQTLPRAARETRDVTLSFALLAFGGLLLALAGSCLLAMWLFTGVTVDHRLVGPLPPAPSPQLQSDPSQQMAQFHAAEMKWLNGAGWTDEAHTTAHIPIDAAMRRVARDGIADWPTQ